MRKKFFNFSFSFHPPRKEKKGTNVYFFRCFALFILILLAFCRSSSIGRRAIVVFFLFGYTIKSCLHFRRTKNFLAALFILFNNSLVYYYCENRFIYPYSIFHDPILAIIKYIWMQSPYVWQLVRENLLNNYDLS